MSVIEVRHRSGTFVECIQTADADFLRLYRFLASYNVIFFLFCGVFGIVVVSFDFFCYDGVWSQTAYKEAKKLGQARVAGSTEGEQFRRVPRQDEIQLDPNTAYVHLTSNNTIYGTQWRSEPEVGDLPLICDASSDVLSRPL